MRITNSIVRFLWAITIAVILLPRLASGAPIPPEIKSVVAFVFTPGSGSSPEKPVPWGTAFFIGVPHPNNSDRSFLYLVTAKHVLQSDDRKSWLSKILLRLNTKKGGISFIEVPIIPDGQERTVFSHPSDSTADVAVIPFWVDVEHFELKFLPSDLLTSKEDFLALDIVEGSEVFFSGLFTPHVGTQRNYPVIRFGRVAMITGEKVRFTDYDADLYLIESASYGGNSGSPVFFYLGADRKPGTLFVGPPVIKLAGVISGTFLDAQPLRAVETAKLAVASSNMGIAAVVPAYKVMEILSGPELTAHRQR